ncbi:MAG: excinuclease ABC subunit UvrC [Eubacteriales bacterium]|nr:excinuclease ABC subunit UvrC [Eubacteriales bacterium]
MSPELSDRQPLDARLEFVPTNPGVYLMKDATGSIIYVGKAINLRNRLRSYFTANPQGNAKVLAMISHIADFQFIVVSSELEALMLEATLIKKHQPHYNILLRDDKSYPYIRVTMNELYPRMVKAFRVGEDKKQGARYYGPYLSGDLFRALAVLREIFPTKTCNRVFPRDIGKERPCLNYHIGRCIGPCRGDVSSDDYRAVMQDICRFLEGKYSPIIENLRQKMDQAADELRFEEASLWRDRLQTLDRLIEKQQAVSDKGDNRDIVGLARNGNEVCLQKLEIREGRLVSSVSFFFPEDQAEPADLVAAFLTQYYPDAAEIPREIFVPVELPEPEGLVDFLKSLRHGACQLIVPQRGANRALLLLANENAEQSLRRHTLLGGHGQTALQEAMRVLGEATGVTTGVHRIEAYDISNTGRQDIAGSQVVFFEGKPARQQYRQYKVKTITAPDDYEAMREVLRRRIAHLGDETFGSRPDLILVDGGKGHVQAALLVLSEFQLAIPVAGMVKDERHRTRGLALANGEILELRNLVAQQDASAMGLLRLLTAIQDEAHRFAQRLNQNMLKKRTVKMSLETIRQVGPSRRRLLLNHFLSIKGVSEATLEQLLALPGLGTTAAHATYQHFHEET